MKAKLWVGDTLVLYTDGMIEPGDRSNGDGPEWLAAQLAKTAGADPDSIAEHLTQAAIRRQGGEPRDDIAVLVLHRRGA